MALYKAKKAGQTLAAQKKQEEVGLGLRYANENLLR